MNEKRPIVLVVDEEATYLRVWEKIFRDYECDCHLVDNFEDAHELVKENHIDFLISEAIMTRSNGYELVREAQKANPNVQVILTTTHESHLARFNLKDPRFYILHKPFHSIDNLVHFVDDIIHKKDPRSDASFDEDSWSENDTYPDVMEWKL